MRMLLLPMLCGAWAAAQAPPDYAARVAELERTHQARPSDPQVVEALAGSYTMAGEYQKAIRLLEHIPAAALTPDLELRLARNLAFAGQTGRAIRRYEAYRHARPHDRQAAVELIRLRRYHGDYEQAEKLCDELLWANPDDYEALALKAEVLHWAGNRRFLARRTAQRAARAAVEYPDAKVAQVYALRDLGQNREARQEFAALSDQVSRRGGVTAQSTFGDAYRLLEGELAHPAVVVNTPAASVYNDSDGIHNDAWSLRLATPFRDDHRLLLDLGHSRSSAPDSSPFTDRRSVSSRTEFQAGGMFRVAPGASFILLGGASRRQSQSGLAPVFELQVTASPADRWTLEFAAGREFLALTPRAIDRDISSYRLAGGVQYALDSRTSLAVRGERRYWSDDNRSLNAETALRRILHYYKPFMVDAGVLSRWEKFDRDTQFASGFFTPDQYRRHDGFLGLHGELGRLSWELRGAGGAQRVARAADYRPDWEATATATVRLSRVLRLSGGYQRRNYSLLSRDGWYQGFFVSLGIQP